MNRIRKTLICLSIAAVLGAGSAHANETLRLPAASAHDQVPAELHTGTRAALPGVQPSREAVRFAWALETRESLDLLPRPFVQHSREYWVDLSAEQLRQGVALELTAPGAVLRLSPRLDGRAARGLAASDIELRQGGESLAAGRGINALADASQLRAAGASFPEGTLAFRLDAGVGHQDLELAVPGASTDMLLHVFEPESGVQLQLTTDRDTVAHGDTMQITARLESRDRRSAQVDSISGLLSSPSGALLDLDFQPDGRGNFVAQVKHDALMGAGAGLWEVHASLQGRSGRDSLRRDARTALASSLPTARLSGEASRQISRDGNMELVFGIEVAAEGRYELRGVLFGTAADGSMQPFAVAQSADWLSPGRASLVLEVSRELFESARDLAAPFEVRDLRLLNQGAMELMERRLQGPSFGAQLADTGAPARRR